MSGENRELIVETIHSKLMEVGEKVKNGEIPIELFYITKVNARKNSKQQFIITIKFVGYRHSQIVHLTCWS